MTGLGRLAFEEVGGVVMRGALYVERLRVERLRVERLRMKRLRVERLRVGATRRVLTDRDRARG